MKNTKTNKTIERIHNRVKNFVEESDYLNYLKFIKKFRNRSFFNQMLIYICKENATFVMGYKQWIDKFNRIVPCNMQYASSRNVAPICSFFMASYSECIVQLLNAS